MVGDWFESPLGHVLTYMESSGLAPDYYCIFSWLVHDSYQQLGVSSARPAEPTLGEYVPVVADAVTAGARRFYGSYWNRVVEHWCGPSPGRADAIGDPPADGPRAHPRR